LSLGRIEAMLNLNWLNRNRLDLGARCGLAQVLVDRLPNGVVNRTEVGERDVGDLQACDQLDVRRCRRWPQVGEYDLFVANPGDERLVVQLVLDDVAPRDLHREHNVHGSGLK
jgi:hypothetical protein